jgi:uncharacterized membrane protein required for colicin V production
MPIAILDLVVIGVVVISALLAAVRGATREVLAIVAWVAAFAVAPGICIRLRCPTRGNTSTNDNIALVAAIGGIFLVTLIIVSLITVKISDAILDSRIGAIDRTLGFVFGAFRGFLICAIGWIFLDLARPGPDARLDGGGPHAADAGGDEREHDHDFDMDGDTLREECGVFGIFGHPDAAAITALGLHALQHRGQEAAGIVTFDGKRFHPSASSGSSATPSPTAPHRPPARQRRHRPCALLDHRRDGDAQRAAALRRTRGRRLRRRA